MIQIENEKIKIAIEETGGKLYSIKTKEDDREYLWQGDRRYWGGRAPNLFPFIGRLYQKQYTLNGETFPMNIHGFLSKSLLEIEAEASDEVVLVLKDNEETRKIYPFAFTFRMTYRLENSTLMIREQVTNNDYADMYFALGGHPGFNVPLEEGLSFEDYCIEFAQACQPVHVVLDENVLDDGTREPYPILNGRILPLRHSLFPHDALVLTDVCRCLSIVSEKGKHGIQVDFPSFPYVGFWQKPGSDAPYICIEPWSALPGREGVVEDLTTMPGLTKLRTDEASIFRWSITLF